MADDDPYELLEQGEPTGIVELPVEWIRDDAVYFNMHRFNGLRPHTPPTAVYDIFFREFERAYEEGGLFLLTMHPHVTGYRSRIWILEKLLEEITRRSDVWVATHAEIAAFVKAGMPLMKCPARARDVGLACGNLPTGDLNSIARRTGCSRRPSHAGRWRDPHRGDSHHSP